MAFRRRGRASGLGCCGWMVAGGRGWWSGRNEERGGWRGEWGWGWWRLGSWGWLEGERRVWVERVKEGIFGSSLGMRVWVGGQLGRLVAMGCRYKRRWVVYVCFSVSVVTEPLVRGDWVPVAIASDLRSCVGGWK